MQTKQISIKKIITFASAIVLCIVFSYSVAANHLTTKAQAREPYLMGNQTEGDAHEVGSVAITTNPEKVKSIAEQTDLTVVFESEVSGGQTIIELEEPVDDPRVKNLNKRGDVSTEKNERYQLLFTPNDTNYSSQWNMTKIKTPAAWDITRGSSDTTIAVIDSGILFEQEVDGDVFTQPDFPLSRSWTNAQEIGMTEPSDTCWTGEPEDKRFNNCDDSGNDKIDDWRGWDFMGGFRGNGEQCPNHSDGITYQSIDDVDFIIQDNDPGPYSCDNPLLPNQLNKTHYSGICATQDQDDYQIAACGVGHGTQVASIAASQTNNSQLVAGIDHNAQIMNIRAFDGYGYSTTSRIAASIEYAVEQSATIINMSFAAETCNNASFSGTILDDAIASAASSGVILVAASGNNGSTSSICFPASSPHVIAVGASDQNDQRYSYSSGSNKLDVVAPAGVPAANAPSNYQNSNYVTPVHGTSFSAPHVAGLVGLLKSVNPTLNPSNIQLILHSSAVKVLQMHGSNKTNLHGYGRINALAALKHAETAAYGNIRLIQCSGKKYLVERGIVRKRVISQDAIKQWELSNHYFNVGDKGCSYPAYSLPLDRVVRSRNTQREYLVLNKNAHRIHFLLAAQSWGVESYQTTTYPQLDGASIHFLQVESSLPMHQPDLSEQKIRFFKCGATKYLVERGIRTKRQITTPALQYWGVEDTYFTPNDKGCSYKTYALPLNRVIRSRNTQRTYLVDSENAYWIKSQEAATSWGVNEDYQTTTYPQFNDTSINYLQVIDELPVV